MASLKLLLGMVPATEKIEQEEKALVSEFEKLKSFSESNQLARYNELNDLINSEGFKQKKKEIEGLSYKTSEEYAKEKEFLSLKKAKDIVLYFKTVEGNSLKKFRELDGSEKIKKYEELKQLVSDTGFKEKMKSKDFADSDNAKKLAEFRQMNSSPEIKEYYKFKSSKEYSNFLNLDGSARLARYNELKDYVGTKEFKERKEYLLDKKRFEKTNEFKQLQEYLNLKNNPDIIWYFKVKDSNKFDVLKNRELVFSDEFEGEKIDKNKWLTNYYWGEKLLHDRYSLESDLHFYTDNGNFEVRNSYLKIITKPQKITGKAWSPVKGFFTKEFSYTSGIINTGISFRQKYGIFSAKIKLGNPNARNSFWLIADKITPHVNICTTSDGNVWLGLFDENGRKVKSKLGSKFAAKSFIYTLEWTPQMMVWKINGIEALKLTENVPQEPMFVNLSGGTTRPLNGMTSMEIDWVRVYQMKQ
ncbi:MAG TPA: glycoside hydrolase family 16 protein [Bacteroidales bacterium]|nr:glycoside hydrolase family 16 protein [Bacteroidales bacterium]HQG36681.1 glycoside hydrolase family 16 protein [Bacteroidales bacterium]HQG52176.1 glycoside hydrolase family 16 protein [Bacteroidales bacterium]HQJ19962.1 glycoside hydrolase family 16 protein [Bacteroidales bacterium]